MEALVFGGAIAFILLISIPIWCLWGYLTLGGAFKKAGMPWWYSIIPIFNQFAFYKLVYGKYSTLWKVIGLWLLGAISNLLAEQMIDNIAIFMALCIVSHCPSDLTMAHANPVHDGTFVASFVAFLFSP